MSIQAALTEAARAALKKDERIQSAWLSGSLADGTSDAWSDVDIAAVVAADALPGAFAAFASDLSAITTVVHSFTLYDRIVSVVTPEWGRLDLLFITPEEIARRDPSGLKVLFAREGAARPSGHAPRVRPASDQELQDGAREFLRVLGLSAIVPARDDYVTAVDGAMLLRTMLIDLMLAENGRARSERSVKRVATLLTPAQRAELAALPPLAANHESFLAANTALAGAYIPRAKALFASRGLEWPNAFEEATRRWLAASINLAI